MRNPNETDLEEICGIIATVEALRNVGANAEECQFVFNNLVEICEIVKLRNALTCNGITHREQEESETPSDYIAYLVELLTCNEDEDDELDMCKDVDEDELER